MPQFRNHMRSAGVVTAIAVAGMTLAGCASSSESTEAGGEKITYWLWDTNQQPAYTQCATAFTEKTGIDVTIEQYGWADYWQGLTTGFAAGTAPDVFADHLSYYPQFVSQGQLLDISDRIDADGIDLSIYQDGLADLWVDQEGGRYGLPKDFDTVALFYNETMVTDAGIDPAALSEAAWNPTDGGTFEQAVAALTVDENGVRGTEAGFDKNNVAVYGLALSGNGLNASGQQTWAPYALGNDWYFGDTTPWTTEWNFDAPEFTDTLAWYKSLQDKGYMPTIDIALSEQDPLNGYLAGRYALVTDGSWMNSSYLGQSDVPTKVAPTPVGPSGERASVFNGLSDGIWAGTKNPDAAWEWVSYLASTDCQDVVADAAVVFPAIKTSTEKATEAFAAKGWDVSGFAVQVDEGTTALLPIADHWSEINDLVTANSQAFLKGSVDAESFTGVNDQVNALFQ
ncbi:ABC transporter substrate-binding protein [Agromyces atrinae]|uniref:Multiple sugar transport system substrate-binding protein n=1 Tax=Agromyces atrinae TaxID=592376 RepID=A0A4Q2M742_9MICO|nr:sugar ABC transporter substrate-binding protein [Agromyces atrinae]NYD67769.1 multiple sugar transport system substrate-binding protein [Agromyces atrinae]RXZ88044.1 sugar ABC transporter substrate-binding protein [Agromyces atrinae]